MVLPASVKAGDPAFGWVEQFKRAVPAKNDEAWTAGQIVVADAANNRFAKSASQKQVGIKGIVFLDKATTEDMGTIYLAPAIVYSKYLPAAALKVFSIVQTSATAGGWEAKTADGTYGTDIGSVGFAQVMGKAGQGGGGLVNDITDIAQNEIVRLRLL